MVRRRGSLRETRGAIRDYAQHQQGTRYVTPGRASGGETLVLGGIYVFHLLKLLVFEPFNVLLVVKEAELEGLGTTVYFVLPQ